MDKKKIALHNLGCKVNAYEMEKMAGKLISDGFTIVPFENRADYYIVNTCSVTNIADRKTRQMLHRAKQKNPEAVVIAAGCYVDSRGEEEVYEEGIDIAVPNSGKENIVEIIRAWEISHKGKNTVTDYIPDEGRNPGNGGHRSGEGGYSRKFLKVQDGCNMFCSYCIIPYARGRIKSRSISDVTEEVKDCVKEGYSEFVLTGIHLSSFGKDRPEDGEDLQGLIKALDGEEGVKRIRLGSLEPGIITEELLREIGDIPSLCPHFHLSLQSGCDSVLKRMNRHYSTEEYLKSLEMLRQTFDDPAITTDVIVGFPGETGEEFRETREFIKRAGFYETHIFPYSRRKGTAADKMEGQIDRKEKHERLCILKELDSENRRAYEDRHKGKRAEVLIEENNSGYTREYIRVVCEGEPLRPGTIVSGSIGERRKDGHIGFCPDM